MSNHFDFGGEIVWRPSAETAERARLSAFMVRCNISYFTELMELSTNDIAWFTGEVLKYLDIQFYEPYPKVLDRLSGQEE